MRAIGKLVLFPIDIAAPGSGGSGALSGMFGKKTISEAAVKSVRFLIAVVSCNP